MNPHQGRSNSNRPTLIQSPYIHNRKIKLAIEYLLSSYVFANKQKASENACTVTFQSINWFSLQRIPLMRIFNVVYIVVFGSLWRRGCVMTSPHHVIWCKLRSTKIDTMTARHDIGINYTFEKRYYVFHPLHSVCLSVCVCVCLSVITFAARWLDLATWRQVGLILSKRTWKCNTSQDDPFPFPFNMDHRYKITFWPVTSKLMDGFTPNFTCM